jgi:hypothetical protein
MSQSKKNTAMGILVSSGEKARFKSQDPRWETGEIVGIRKGTKHKNKQSDEHKRKRFESRSKSWKGFTVEIKSKMSNLRKGKKSAYTAFGESLGLVDILDQRWGTEIFSKKDLKFQKTIQDLLPS